MPESAIARRHFPYTACVGDNRVTLRLMTTEDRETFLAFMRGQPEDDLFFLLVDVTTPEGLEHWMRDLEEGRNITVLAEENGTLVFAEVRMRGPGNFGGAAESVTAAKRSRLIAAARLYLTRKPEVACRFDVFLVDPVRIEWVRNAFAE